MRVIARRLRDEAIRKRGGFVVALRVAASNSGIASQSLAMTHKKTLRSCIYTSRLCDENVFAFKKCICI